MNHIFSEVEADTEASYLTNERPKSTTQKLKEAYF